MPNFHQLQTYLATQAADLPAQLEAVDTCWQELIGEDKDIKQYLSSIHWANDHSQCIIPNYRGTWKRIGPSGGTHLLVRPLLMLWVPDGHRHHNRFWIEVSILIDGPNLLDVEGNYLKHTLSLVRKLAAATQRYFPDHKGIFFTDEAQDGVPWEGWLTSKSNLLWEMDAAWLPKGVLSDYLPIKDAFLLNKKEQGAEILNLERWQNNLGLGRQS